MPGGRTPVARRAAAAAEQPCSSVTVARPRDGRCVVAGGQALPPVPQPGAAAMKAADDRQRQPRVGLGRCHRRAPKGWALPPELPAPQLCRAACWATGAAAQCRRRGAAKAAHGAIAPGRLRLVAGTAAAVAPPVRHSARTPPSPRHPRRIIHIHRRGPRMGNTRRREPACRPWRPIRPGRVPGRVPGWGTPREGAPSRRVLGGATRGPSNLNFPPAGHGLAGRGSVEASEPRQPGRKKLWAQGSARGSRTVAAPHGIHGGLCQDALGHRLATPRALSAHLKGRPGGQGGAEMHPPPGVGADGVGPPVGPQRKRAQRPVAVRGGRGRVRVGALWAPCGGWPRARGASPLAGGGAVGAAPHPRAGGCSQRLCCRGSPPQKRNRSTAEANSGSAEDVRRM